MEELVKKVLYTGVGLVATTTEKLQKAVNELVDKGQVPQEEGKKIVDDFVNSTEEKKNEFEKRAIEMFEAVVRKLDIPTKSEYEALSKRLAKVEKAAKTTRTRTVAATADAKQLKVNNTLASQTLYDKVWLFLCL